MKRMTSRKVRRAGVLALSGALVLSMGSAFAGEVNGNGDVVPGGANGRSECSYSGQQDDPIEDQGIFRGDRVQSWGQIGKMLRAILTSIGMHPGEACNPKKSG